MRLVPLFVIAITGCASSQGPGPGGGLRLLFIGNSLTYVNDVPGIVQALADSSGAGPITVETVAFPDFALVDHWNEGSALRAIRRGGWDLVVLQQGPSSVAINRDSLRLFTQRFGMAITAQGARAALYSAWPSATRRDDFARAIESYTLAAADVNGLLFPIASSWLAAWRRDSSIVLYASDGLHASTPGSYLAALVIYATITNRSPIGLPRSVRVHSGATLTVGANLVSHLQEAASEVTR